MLLKLFLLLAPFSVALQAPSEPLSSRPGSLALPDNPDDGGDITGVFGGVTFDHEGWAWFSIGDKQLRMKTANFPDPVPYPGTMMTATGCTPDPANPGSFICTGVQ